MKCTTEKRKEKCFVACGCSNITSVGQWTCKCWHRSQVETEHSNHFTSRLPPPLSMYTGTYGHGIHTATLPHPKPDHIISPYLLIIHLNTTSHLCITFIHTNLKPLKLQQQIFRFVLLTFPPQKRMRHIRCPRYIIIKRIPLLCKWQGFSFIPHSSQTSNIAGPERVEP